MPYAPLVLPISVNGVECLVRVYPTSDPLLLPDAVRETACPSLCGNALYTVRPMGRLETGASPSPELSRESAGQPVA
jgi:hypothetical protein